MARRATQGQMFKEAKKTCSWITTYNHFLLTEIINQRRLLMFILSLQLQKKNAIS